MVNYQLRKLSKYHGKTLCGSNWALRHTEKGTEIKIKSKSRYDARSFNRVV